MPDNIEVQLPDGGKRNYAEALTGMDVARDISPSLAKRAVACKVDGTLRDLSCTLSRNCQLEIICADSPDGLEIIRHDCAHLLADAVKALYPDIQVAIGPNIENGFYYDFLKEDPFSEGDLEAIENKMREIARTKKPIERMVFSREEAMEYFRSIDEFLKVEIIKSIPGDEEISVYKQGEFMDVCRGPHSPNVYFARHFKLLKVSGSYWKGDQNNPQLQRIYGTAWDSEEALSRYLNMLEEADRRDHRRIASALELFHISSSAVGSIFWHPNGLHIFLTLQDYIRQKLNANGYIEVRTPQLLSKELWEKSGHWDKYRDNMFISESEKEVLAIKPMNCPAHIEIFNQDIRSYRNLPIRMAEFGSCHRNEPSGSLHGIMRVRSFTQDDAHIFCTEDQVKDETIAFCELLIEVYRDFGFNDVQIRFSDRPEQRVGDDALWDRAETSLMNAVHEAGYEYSLNKGDGAFYGPKLEFVLRDAIGREWQCGTLQADFVLPRRLGAQYVAESGKKVDCVMLHRAILGSFERFIGILIEDHAGKFPLWLAPVQVAVCTVVNKCDGYAAKVFDAMRQAGLKVVLDDASGKISSKIKKYSLQKVPYIVIIGEKEVESDNVCIRTFGEPSVGDVHLPVLEFISAVKFLVDSKSASYKFA